MGVERRKTGGGPSVMHDKNATSEIWSRRQGSREHLKRTLQSGLRTLQSGLRALQSVVRTLHSRVLTPHSRLQMDWGRRPNSGRISGVEFQRDPAPHQEARRPLKTQAGGLLFAFGGQDAPDCLENTIVPEPAAAPPLVLPSWLASCILRGPLPFRHFFELWRSS